MSAQKTENHVRQEYPAVSAANYAAISWTPVEFVLMTGVGTLRMGDGQPEWAGVMWSGAVSMSPQAAKSLRDELTKAVELFENSYGEIHLNASKARVVPFEPKLVEPVAEPEAELKCRACAMPVRSDHAVWCSRRRQAWDEANFRAIVETVSPQDC